MLCSWFQAILRGSLYDFTLSLNVVQTSTGSNRAHSQPYSQADGGASAYDQMTKSEQIDIAHIAFLPKFRVGKLIRDLKLK